MTFSYNRIAGSSLERLAALSDGIFAVAMTLLVLDIHVPEKAEIHDEQSLIHALGLLAPRFLVFLMSVMTLGIFWVGQQTQFNNLTRAARHFTWIHILFLAAISVMPFSTNLLAGFIGYRVALLVYWLNILVPGLLLYLSWRVARAESLTKEETTEEIACAIERRILIAQALYAFGALLCLLNPYWSIGFILVVQLNYAVAPRIPFLSRL
jgi:uncharacterized membrane protein